MPSFLSTYSSVGIPVVPRASQPPVPALSAPSLFDYSLVPSTSSPTLAPSVGKAFVVGPGYAPIPGKLVAKITSGAFVELADLLAENIRVQEADPHTYLDGKLLVAPAKKRVVEITDILTWIQAFTIYQWIFCSTYPSRWQETTQYKLLILQTASQSPGAAWLNYDTAFRKDAAASLLADWSKMNLDLYNFHTLRPAPLPVNQHLTRLPYPIPQPHRTSHPSVPSTPFSIVDLGTMVPVAGLWVNVATVMLANDVMVNTPLPTAPFEPTGVSAFPIPHSIRGKMPSVLTTRLPCRWQPPLV